MNLVLTKLTVRKKYPMTPICETAVFLPVNKKMRLLNYVRGLYMIKFEEMLM